MFFFVSFAKEPLTWQSWHPGGRQGLAAAATEWLSKEGQTVLSRGPNSSEHPLHPRPNAEKASKSQGVLPPFLHRAQGLPKAGTDFSAACADLAVGGGIVQRKLKRVIFVKNK